MKKAYSVVIGIALCLLLAACANNVNVSITGASSKFSREEIENAAQCVKQKFKEFKGCELINLRYDEEKSDLFIKGYLESGRGSVNGATAENTIVLLSDFKVDASGADEGLNPDSTYYDWNWILIRDGKSGEWKVDGWGY
jgi:hypothetical protein